MDKITRITPEELRNVVSQKGFNLRLITKDYYITVLLYLLKDVEGLYFKGGTALQKIFLDYSRISEDIDYTLNEPLVKIRKKVEEKVQYSNIFEKITTAKNVRGFVRLVVHYAGLSGEAGTIFIDLNERGSLLLQPEKFVITHFYPENIPLFSVATLHSKELMAEKMAAAIGRNRPRDHFDLYKIIQHNFPLDLELVKQKCISSGDEFDVIKMFTKAQILKKRWDLDLAPLLVEQITFKEVMSTLAKHFNLKHEKALKKLLVSQKSPSDFLGEEKEKKKKTMEEIGNSNGYKKLLKDISSLIEKLPPKVRSEMRKH